MLDLNAKIEILFKDALQKKAEENANGRGVRKRKRRQVKVSDITPTLINSIKSKLHVKLLKAFVRVRDPTHSSLKLKKDSLLDAAFKLRAKRPLSKDDLMPSISRAGGDDDDDDVSPQSSTLLAGILAVKENTKRIKEAYRVLELENEGIVFERFQQNCLSLQTCLQDHVNRLVLDQEHNGINNNVWEWTRVRSI